MKSKATRGFWTAFEKLPDAIKGRARTAYSQFETDPSHPSLQFKSVHASRPIFSARITRAYRAIGLVDGEVVTWIWIGNHDDYERLLGRV